MVPAVVAVNLVPTSTAAGSGSAAIAGTEAPKKVVDACAVYAEVAAPMAKPGTAARRTAALVSARRNVAADMDGTPFVADVPRRVSAW